MIRRRPGVQQTLTAMRDNAAALDPDTTDPATLLPAALGLPADASPAVCLAALVRVLSRTLEALDTPTQEQPTTPARPGPPGSLSAVSLSATAAPGRHNTPGYYNLGGGITGTHYPG